MEHTEIAELDVLPDEVDVELDVLGVLVVYGVAGHAHRRDAVAVCHRSLRDGAMELAEQMPEPDALSCRVLHRLVFSLGAGAGHGRLWLGGPRDKRLAEEHIETGC